MDKRLDQALEFSNFRSILSTRQENLKGLLQNRLLLTYEGGLFSVDHNLISAIQALITSGKKEYIFIDKNDTPILITHLSNFLSEVTLKHEDALARYHESYKKLKDAREIRKVIDWNEKEAKKE